MHGLLDVSTSINYRYLMIHTFVCGCVFSSKDSFVKWWDLDTQHCFKTLVGHRSEVSTERTCSGSLQDGLLSARHKLKRTL